MNKMKKIVILDTLKEAVIVFDINIQSTTPEDLLELLLELDIISSLNNIHWQVMNNFTIKNYTK